MQTPYRDQRSLLELLCLHMLLQMHCSSLITWLMHLMCIGKAEGMWVLAVKGSSNTEG